MSLLSSSRYPFNKEGSKNLLAAETEAHLKHHAKRARHLNKEQRGNQMKEAPPVPDISCEVTFGETTNELFLHSVDLNQFCVLNLQERFVHLAHLVFI